MNTLFFDDLIIANRLEKKIKKISVSSEEKEELWVLVEEIVYHKVIGCCLNCLPDKNHNEFLEMFHKSPHDENIFSYLNSKSRKDMKKIIKEEIKNLTKDLLLLSSDKV